MEVAAGIVAFVTIAAQSAKLIHEAAAAYGGGPQDVKQLLQGIASLCHVLQQLSAHLLAAPELTLPADLARNLKVSLKDARRQMDAYRMILNRCLPAPDDTILRRMMMRFRPLLYQQDFEKMRQSVLLHLSVITFHTEIVNGIRVAGISQQMTVLDRNGQQALALQLQQEHCAAAFHSNTETILNASHLSLQAIDKGLHEVPGLLNYHFENLRRQTTSPRFRGLEESLLHLHHKLDQLPRPYIGTRPPSVVEAVQVTSLSLPTKLSSTVEISVASLHTLVEQLYALQLQGSVFLPTKQSEKLLQALRILLGSIKDTASTGMDVKTMLSILDIANRIKLQREGKWRVTTQSKRYSCCLDGGISLVDSPGIISSMITGQVESPLGRLVFWSRTSHSLLNAVYRDEPTPMDNSHFDGAIWMNVGKQPNAYRVCISLARHSSDEGVILPHPFIRVSKVLADDSVALKAIRQGDLHSLREAIFRDEVRPVDCDEAGRGLINIACFHGHASIARYLISLGADIHVLERRVDELWDCEACHLIDSSLWDHQGFLCIPARSKMRHENAGGLLHLAHILFGKWTIAPHPSQKQDDHRGALQRHLKGDRTTRIPPIREWYHATISGDKREDS